MVAQFNNKPAVRPPCAPVPSRSLPSSRRKDIIDFVAENLRSTEALLELNVLDPLAIAYGTQRLPLPALGSPQGFWVGLNAPEKTLAKRIFATGLERLGLEIKSIVDKPCVSYFRVQRRSATLQVAKLR